MGSSSGTRLPEIATSERVFDRPKAVPERNMLLERGFRAGIPSKWIDFAE
ncbi:hypothetical protein [Nocardia sp. NPDC059691]